MGHSSQGRATHAGGLRREEDGLLPFEMTHDTRTKKAAQIEDAGVDNGVNGLCPVARELDQSGRAENGQMLRH
jgi:hypothetical protein